MFHISVKLLDISSRMPRIPRIPCTHAGLPFPEAIVCVSCCHTIPNSHLLHKGLQPNLLNYFHTGTVPHTLGRIIIIRVDLEFEYNTVMSIHSFADVSR